MSPFSILANRFPRPRKVLVALALLAAQLLSASEQLEASYSFYERYRSLIWVAAAVVLSLLLLLALSLVYSIAQRRLKESIRSSEERLSLALAATNAGIWEYDPRTGRTYYDPRWYLMLGYAECCLPNEYGTWAELLHPEDRARAEAEMHRHVEEGTDYATEYRMRAQDGSWRWISSSGKVVARDAGGRALRVVGTHVDVTARKQAEESIRESERRYRFLYEKSPAMSIILDAEGIVTDVNGAFVASLGYTREEVIGRPLLDFIVPEQRERAAAEIAEDLKGAATPQVELDARAKDGTVHTILFSEATALLYEGDRLRGMLTTGLDTTERKRAMEQARNQQQQLIQADKMASLGILVSGVAHEINNPNNYILLNGKICSKVWDDIQPVLREYYEARGDYLLAGMPYSEAQPRIGPLIAGIHEGAQRIKKIVQNLRDFTRKDPGEMTKSLEVNSVVDSAVTLMRNLIDKSTARFEVHCDGALPPVNGNFQQLEQVVINLITNACQALTGRDRGITVRTRRDRAAGTAVIEVRDEGVGIPEENMQHILDPFFTTKQDRGGTGLGLSISYNIVRNHSGDLSIASDPGKGTCVTVTLPLACTAAGAGEQR